MSARDKKGGNVGKKFVKFFSSIKSELKKVVWPDRKKLVQSTVTVLAICLIMAGVVFAIDKVLSGALGAMGFYPETSKEAVTTPSATMPAVPTLGATSQKSDSSAEVSSPETSDGASQGQEGEEEVEDTDVDTEADADTDANTETETNTESASE